MSIWTSWPGARSEDCWVPTMMASGIVSDPIEGCDRRLAIAELRKVSPDGSTVVRSDLGCKFGSWMSSSVPSGVTARPRDREASSVAAVMGRWVSLTDAPDLLAPAYAFSSEDEPGAAFMAHDLAGSLVTAKRIAKLWPDFLLALVLDDGAVAARAVAVPFDGTGADRSRLPDTGWDGVVQWAFADLLDGRQPSAACALEIAIDPAHRSRGISGSAIEALRAVVARRGWRELVAPLRPPDPAAGSRQSMTSPRCETSRRCRLPTAATSTHCTPSQV
jgi:GNAT superfamily N-acetyltransferase